MSKGTELKEIGRNQYLQVVGLLALAHKHMALVNECEAAIASIVEPGVYEGGGHSGDAIWQPYTAEELLKRANVTVAER